MPRGYYFWRRARIEGTGCKNVDNGDSNGVHRGRLQGDKQRAPAGATGIKVAPPHEQGLRNGERLCRPECAGRVAILRAAGTADA